MWISDQAADHVELLLRDALSRRKGTAANKGSMSELALLYYQAQQDRGERGCVVNVDVDLISRRWTGGRLETMAWEFKPSYAGRVTSGQQSVLNELAVTIDLGVQAGIYEPTWSGVWVAVMGTHSSPHLVGSICRVLPIKPLENYRQDRPTVVTSPVPLRLVDLLAILKHSNRPPRLLEKINAQGPVLLGELFKA